MTGHDWAGWVGGWVQRLAARDSDGIVRRRSLSVSPSPSPSLRASAPPPPQRGLCLRCSPVPVPRRRSRLTNELDPVTCESRSHRETQRSNRVKHPAPRPRPRHATPGCLRLTLRTSSLAPRRLSSSAQSCFLSLSSSFALPRPVPPLRHSLILVLNRLPTTHCPVPPTPPADLAASHGIPHSTAFPYQDSRARRYHYTSLTSSPPATTTFRLRCNPKPSIAGPTTTRAKHQSTTAHRQQLFRPASVTASRNAGRIRPYALRGHDRRRVPTSPQLLHSVGVDFNHTLYLLAPNTSRSFVLRSTSVAHTVVSHARAHTLPPSTWSSIAPSDIETQPPSDGRV